MPRNHENEAPGLAHETSKRMERHRTLQPLWIYTINNTPL